MGGSLKVGTLAERTGLTVRTLHHYDQIGLLRPSGRTRAGHRLYDLRSVGRLQQITSLRQFGLSLDDIRACLDGGPTEPAAILSRHIARLEERIAAERRLARHLRLIETRLRERGAATMDELLHTIRETVMFEKHYTKEQLDKLEARGREVGQERIEEVQREWAELFRGMEEAMNAGTDPSDPSVQALARKGVALIAEFTGGNAGIERSLGNAYREEQGAMHQAWGVSEEVAEYYGRAMQALRSG